MRLDFDDAVRIHGLIRQGIKFHDIAAIFGVNQGRISEINTGKKFPGSREVANGTRKHPKEIQPVTFNTIKRLTIKPMAVRSDANSVS